MTRVKFSTMWLMLLGGCLYDVAAVRFDWFPEHPAKERFLVDLSIAWFICGAWIITRIQQYFLRVIA